MNTQTLPIVQRLVLPIALAVAYLLSAPFALAQTYAGDDAPQVVESLTRAELQTVVGPVALYPDDLLAIVLPASTFPLQIVQAARYLGAYDNDNTLKPDSTWDESVVALLNYPDVLQLMSDDLEWTQTLGDAIVVQQADVIDAIEDFRDRAYDAGNLKSDKHQRVERTDDAIVITPVEREVIYVPYYEPERVVVVQREPVYHYYPHAYPVYYYPYPAYHSFHRGHFWGVTSAYTIGWHSNFLHINLHSYAGHPYYRRNYVTNYYYHHRHQPRRYRHRPVADSRGDYARVRDRNYRGDEWRPQPRRATQRIEKRRAAPVRVQVDSFRARSQTATTNRRSQPARTTARYSDADATQRTTTKRNSAVQRRDAEPRVARARPSRDTDTAKPRRYADSDTRTQDRRVNTQRDTPSVRPQTRAPARTQHNNDRANREGVRREASRPTQSAPKIAPRSEPRSAPRDKPASDSGNKRESREQRSNKGDKRTKRSERTSSRQRRDR